MTLIPLGRVLRGDHDTLATPLIGPRTAPRQERAMTATKLMTEAEFLHLLLDDPDTHWELHDGELRCKPPMTWEHVRAGSNLHFDLQQQLNRDEYLVLSEAGRLRRSSTRYYLPDVMVVPIALAERLFPEPGMVAAFPDPLPFVAEVLSRSTGTYDVRSKLPEYRRRGDHEIWFIHPYQRTVTAWVRQADGTYVETVYRTGMIALSSLPGVVIDLDALFGS
jgi:Uma2 family endonuclease